MSYMIALQNVLPIKNKNNIISYDIYTASIFNNFILSPFPPFINMMKYYYKLIDICHKRYDGNMEKEIRILLSKLAANGIWYIPYFIYKSDDGTYINPINPITDIPSEGVDNYIDAIIWCIEQNKNEPQYSNDKLLIYFAMTDESDYSNYNDIYNNSFAKLRTLNTK